MSIINRKKDEPECCCGHEISEICCIKVLGSGCKSCRALFDNAVEAVKNAGLDISVEYITDIQRMAEFGVMSLPALVINDKVVSVGKVLKPSEVEKLLR